MSFLNPLFLIALVSVGIPLLIYLLNIRKPKRIRFSTLAFFDSLKSSSLRKIKIKRWLLLALRTLAVAALALALAKPFLPSGLGLMADGEPAVIGIVLDNSPGMDQIDRHGPYIEQAREIASEIINLQDSDNRFAINKTHGESLNLPLLSKNAADREIQQVETANAGNYLAANIRNVISQLESAPEPNKILYIITDGRESQLEALEGLQGDNRYENLQVKLIKLGEAEPSNAGIRDVEIRPAEQGQLLVATVRNYGSQATGSQFINLHIADELIAQHAYDIEPGQDQEFMFEVPVLEQRFIKAELSIEGDELSFDNKYYAAIQLPEQRRVLVVNDNTNSGEFRTYLRPLLEAVSEESSRLSFEFANVDNLSPDKFEGKDAIVLDGVREIPDYLSQAIIESVQGGSGLLLLPAAEGRIDSYNRLLGISNAGRYSNLAGSYGSFQSFDRLAPPQQGHPILDAMFDVEEGDEVRVNLPELFYYYRINTIEGQASAPILTSQAGNVILNETNVGSGKLIYSAIGSDPGWSNFPIKPLFAPLFYRTVDYLASGEGARLNNHQLGEPFEITLAGAAPGSIELIVGEEPIIPTTRQTFTGLNIFYAGAEWKPGWVYVNHGDEKKLHAVNQNAMESSLLALDKQGIDDILGFTFSNYSIQTLDGGGRELLVSDLETASFGKEIWYWFIILAIILLLTESMVSRHYKAETIS